MLTDRSPFTLPAAILGGCFLLSAVFGSWQFYRVKALDHTISVTGSAQKVITSDVAKWRVQLSRTVDIAAVKDGQTQLMSDAKIFMAYLKKNTVDEKAVTTSPVTVMTLTSGYDTGNRPLAYQ